MWNDYGVFGAHELWNNVRTYNYAMRAGLSDNGFSIKRPSCDYLPLICDAPPGGTYHDPETDSAPWWDEAYPESGDFAGLWVQDIVGFDTFGSRTLTATPFGSTASVRQLTPKTLTITAWLLGRTCCATQYGYRWLLSKLRERDCITNAEVSVLSMYDCCPTADEEVLYPTDQDLIDKYLRAMYNVKVAQDPNIIQKLGQCCGTDCSSTSIQVQFTLVLENPRLYRNRQLALSAEPWGDEIKCVQINCDPCEPEETIEQYVTRQKTRYPVSVLSNGTWCPVGDWELSDYFDAPEQGYLDIANIETQNQTLQISVSYDGSWTTVGGWDATTVDLCGVDLEIVEAIQNASVVAPADTHKAIGSNVRTLKLSLSATSSTGGVWETDGSWVNDMLASFPPLYSELQVDNNCGCTDVDSTAEIILNDDGTWDPWLFDYIGILPPAGYTDVIVRRSQPGTYTTLEDVPISEAFLGCGVSRINIPDPFAATSSCYCQPIEWVEYAEQMLFSQGIENAEPYLEFYAGDATLYNFKAEFYQLPSADAVWASGGLLLEDLSCIDPDFAVQVGPSIPAGATVIYEPRTRQINLAYNGQVYDFSASVSGLHGSSPFFLEMPECYGVLVVLSAEVRNGNLPSTLATISLGYTPYVYVGV